MIHPLALTPLSHLQAKVSKPPCQTVTCSGRHHAISSACQQHTSTIFSGIEVLVDEDQVKLKDFEVAGANRNVTSPEVQHGHALTVKPTGTRRWWLTIVLSWASHGTNWSRTGTERGNV